MLADAFTDGVCFVPLASIADPALVAPTIARALGLPEAASQPTDALLKATLRERHLLLVLDNFEHLIAAAPLLTDLLATCPRLSLLVTSRMRLRITDEREYPVPPLALPEPEEQTDSESAFRSRRSASSSHGRKPSNRTSR
jgi:non-specific serine/threonine protein kinase